MNNAWYDARDNYIPKMIVLPKRPWISSKILLLITLRNQPWANQIFDDEKLCNQQIKSQAKEDRRIWLENMLHTGDWDSIRKYCREFSPKRNRIKNMNGDLVASDERNESTSQWSLLFIIHYSVGYIEDKYEMHFVLIHFGQYNEEKKCRGNHDDYYHFSRFGGICM